MIGWRPAPPLTPQQLGSTPTEPCDPRVDKAGTENGWLRVARLKSPHELSEEYYIHAVTYITKSPLLRFESKTWPEPNKSLAHLFHHTRCSSIKPALDCCGIVPSGPDYQVFLKSDICPKFSHMDLLSQYVAMCVCYVRLVLRL